MPAPACHHPRPPLPPQRPLLRPPCLPRFPHPSLTRSLTHSPTSPPPSPSGPPGGCAGCAGGLAGAGGGLRCVVHAVLRCACGAAVHAVQCMVRCSCCAVHAVQCRLHCSAGGCCRQAASNPPTVGGASSPPCLPASCPASRLLSPPPLCTATPRPQEPPRVEARLLEEEALARLVTLLPAGAASSPGGGASWALCRALSMFRAAGSPARFLPPPPSWPAFLPANLPPHTRAGAHTHACLHWPQAAATRRCSRCWPPCCACCSARRGWRWRWRRWVVLSPVLVVQGAASQEGRPAGTELSILLSFQLLSAPMPRPCLPATLATQPRLPSVFIAPVPSLQTPGSAPEESPPATPPQPAGTARRAASPRASWSC